MALAYGISIYYQVESPFHMLIILGLFQLQLKSSLNNFKNYLCFQYVKVKLIYFFFK